MTYSELKDIVSGDYNRYPSNWGVTLRVLLLPQFNVLFWFRCLTWLKGKGGLWKLLYTPLSYYHRWNCAWVGVDIAPGSNIGKGLLIQHCGAIVVNPCSQIGENCTLFQSVTIGEWKGKRPQIGNNVTIFAGASVIGNVKVGNNVVIGANALVVRDVPDGAVVAGNPAKVVSMKGEEYTMR